MISKVLLSLGAAGLSLAALAQNPSPVAVDPLANSGVQIQAVNEPARRAALLQFLAGARVNYGLRAAGQAYDLKVTFNVNSGGVTAYDGPWQMEDIFDPQLGLRWTASSGSYSITRISANGALYGIETGDHVPLRLHEARAALFDPIPSAQNANRSAIRTAGASFNGDQLTCILLSGAGNRRAVNVAPPAPGRRWDETEECIDPQSGLLRVHSQVPGRYYLYDYTDAPRLSNGRILPRRVIVSEAGKTVTEILVDSLREVSPDPNLFAPTDEMRAKGRPVFLGTAQKLFRAFPGSPIAGTVCVFGLVTPSGELVEAHSLQPDDPTSQAALQAAGNITLSPIPATGGHPQQYFVFIVERFTK